MQYLGNLVQPLCNFIQPRVQALCIHVAPLCNHVEPLYNLCTCGPEPGSNLDLDLDKFVIIRNGIVDLG